MITILLLLQLLQQRLHLLMTALLLLHLHLLLHLLHTLLRHVLLLLGRHAAHNTGGRLGRMRPTCRRRTGRPGIKLLTLAAHGRLLLLLLLHLLLVHRGLRYGRNGRGWLHDKLLRVRIQAGFRLRGGIWCG